MEESNIMNIIDANPSAIFDVNHDLNLFFIKHNDGSYDAIKVDKKEDFNHCISLLKEEIKTRPVVSKRAAEWECKDAFGNYSPFIYMQLIEMRKNLPARQKEKMNQRALKELSNYRNIPMCLIEVYVKELRLSNTKEDEQAKEQLRILGL